MPQGRRKVPFSGKAKKEQLKNKKITKDPSLSTKFRSKGVGGPKIAFLKERSDSDNEPNDILRLNMQPSKKGSSPNINRYVLQFHRETDEELKQQKEIAYQELKPVPEKELEISAADFYCEDLDFPKRPPWNFDMSLEQLDSREQKYFNDYIKNIETKYNWKDLGYFELNLETWRQLWRVLEMSDILLFIIDIRFPAAMFPESLYSYVTGTLKKDMILVLNKVDLAPAPLVVAWQHYFREKYPELKVLIFTTFPEYNIRGKQSDKGGLQSRRQRGKLRMAAEGAKQLMETCKLIVQDKVDLNSWETKIAEELHLEYEQVEVGEHIEEKNVNTAYEEHEKYKNGILTIGCVGQPNVGKSSLMNSIMGKKVVSVSRTPGHTKHFQTIFLTENVRLCDCPGLVFPSKVPKNMQVIMGTFPIAQLRQPYSAIRFIAERMNLISALRIQHPEEDDAWSPMDICEAWARKRGFLTAKAARPDTYRAANHLLRMQLEGKICLCLQPPGYNENKTKWETHAELENVLWIQAKSKDNEQPIATRLLEVSDLEESDNNGDDESSTLDKDTNSDENDEDDDDDDDDNVGIATQNPFTALLNE